MKIIVWLRTLTIVVAFQVTSVVAQQEVAQAKPSKIIALVRARNEENLMEPFLRALSKYTDSIVLFEDASEDRTLDIVTRLADECHVERIIRKRSWKHDPSLDRNALLAVGRQLGGTHFVIIDVDEMFTANCLKDDYLRKEILALQPGQRLSFHWIRIWGSPYAYRSDKLYKECVFCDDGVSVYASVPLHESRIPDTKIPAELKISSKVIDPETMGLLHFQATNRRNMSVRMAWYRCLEHINNPQKSVDWINKFYNHCEHENMKLLQVPAEWYSGYDFLKMEDLMAKEEFREKQVLAWFDQYGRDFFKPLAIWHIDWNAQS